MTNKELFITNTNWTVRDHQDRNCRFIPDEVHLPQSSESTLGSSSLLSEHTPAYRFPSWPQSDKKQTSHLHMRRACESSVADFYKKGLCCEITEPFACNFLTHNIIYCITSLPCMTCCPFLWSPLQTLLQFWTNSRNFWTLSVSWLWNCPHLA